MQHVFDFCNLFKVKAFATQLNSSGESIMEAVMIGCLFFSIRNVWGYAYSNKKEVIDYVSSMIPLLAAGSVLDAIQGTLSGSQLLSYLELETRSTGSRDGIKKHFLLCNDFF